MNNDFEIVTVVTPEYIKLLKWTLPTWTVKPQFAGRPLHVFHSGFKNPEKDLAWIGEYFPDTCAHVWDEKSMPEAENQRERMLSAFVLGAAAVVKTPHYVKLDADCYFTNKDPAFLPEDFEVDLCAHKWGYTKPGWWKEKLDAWTNDREWGGDTSNVGSIGAKRIISWCCLHRTEFVRKVAAITPGRLPIPSHDSYLWYMTNRFDDLSWKAVNLKSRGVNHAKRWKTIREEVCASEAAWNPSLDKALVTNIQLEITTACNLACHNCDRGCGMAKSSECISEKQIARFLNESVRAGKKWGRIDIIGGEPTIHKEFITVLHLLYEYKQFSPKTRFRITTNGHGKFVQSQIEKIPDWIQVRNTAKKDNVHDFTAVNMAPIDMGIDPKDIKACSIPWRCGTAFTRYGYFSCGAGAAVARIFKLDIGIKRLEDFTPENLRKQMKMLCRFCGHSRSRAKEPLVNVQMTSPAWKKSFDTYKDNESIMELY